MVALKCLRSIAVWLWFLLLVTAYVHVFTGEEEALPWN